MEKRQLGNSGISVAPLAFGSNVFGWTIDEKVSFDLLDAFVDFGFDLVDTADMYSTWVAGHSGGESEAIIGKWLKATGKRSKIILATKVGKEMGDGSKGLTRDYIFKAVDDSLRRLQTDYIDLYQSHEDDLDVPLEETLYAYEMLMKQGKIRAIGASNYRGKRLAESLEVSKVKGYPSYISLQPHYNLYERAEFEKELEPLCLEKNIGVISYYSLASGFLTGKYRSEDDLSKSARGGGIAKYFNERGFTILSALDEVAALHHTVPAVISLAWLMQRKSITAPIASATSIKQLSEIVTAVDIKLSHDEIKKLDGASDY